MTPLCCLSDLANDSCQKEQKTKNINGDYLVTSSKPKANPYSLILIFNILTIKNESHHYRTSSTTFYTFSRPDMLLKEKHRSPFRHKQSCVAVLDRLDTNKKGNFGQRGWSPDCFVSEIYPIWGQSRKQLCHRLFLRTPETMFVDLYKIGSRTAFLTRIQWGTLRSDDSDGNENSKKARSNR